MSTQKKSELTMADVRAALRANRTIPDNKRRRIDNALNSVWRWTGRSLYEIPATVSDVAELMRTIEPAAHGVQRATISNARNLVMHAMKQSGCVPALNKYRSRPEPFSPVWAIVSARVSTPYETYTLSPFFQYCNEQRIRPSSVGNDCFQMFAEYRRETSFRANQHSALRNVALVWNKLSDRFPDLQLEKLDPPPSKQRRLKFAMTDFPESLQGSVEAWHSWLICEDVFDDNVRHRAVAKNTASNYRRRVHRVLNILASQTLPTDEITSLHVLIEPANLKRVIKGLQAVDRSKSQSETFQTATILIQMAREWLRCDSQQLVELDRIMARLKRPSMGMTTKNLKLVSQFDDPAARRRLFKAPQLIWERISRDHQLSYRFRLALAQAAIGIGVLTHMPLRLSNLTGLAFGENIILRPNGISSLVISAEETKGGRSIEFDIPADLASLIFEFHDKIAFGALGKHPVWLFCRPDGGRKGFAQVRYLIQTYFKEYVGFHMNPHAFRHVCAKLILDANPGAHTLVQELLGHKSVETSTAYYAGLNSRRAGRFHSQIVQQELSRDTPAPTQRRRRRNEV